MDPNQVMSNSQLGPQSQQETVVAALGTKWWHCVNTRLTLGSCRDTRFVKVMLVSLCQKFNLLVL